MKRCGYCGRENDDAAFHCKECGTPFDDSAPAVVPETINPNKPIHRIMAFVTALIVAFCVAITCLFFSWGLTYDAANAGLPETIIIGVAMLMVTSFAGVFFGTLCFPTEKRYAGSIILLIVGLLVPTVMFIPLWAEATMLLLNLLPASGGGLIAVLIYWKWNKDLSDAAKARRPMIILKWSAAMILTGAILVFVFERAVTVTKDKSIALINKAGGMAALQKEAESVFRQVGTNVDTLEVSELTNCPVIQKLSRNRIMVSGYRFDEPPRMEIYLGNTPHFHYKEIYIFGVNTSSNRIPDWVLKSSHLIALTNNIFITTH